MGSSNDKMKVYPHCGARIYINVVFCNSCIEDTTSKLARDPKASDLKMLQMVSIKALETSEAAQTQKTHDKERGAMMENVKTIGIIMTVIGGAIGLWVFTRFTSMAGKFHTWQPPFTEYEITTLIGGGIALILIIIGLINLTKSSKTNS